MTTCQPGFQQAIYARLTGDAALAAMVTGVFDEVDVSTLTTPFIVIADVHEVSSEAHDRSGIDATAVINIWSRYRGYAEVARINQRVSALLHRPAIPLLVPGFHAVSIFNEMHQFMRDPDPDLRRCMSRYRSWLEAD